MGWLSQSRELLQSAGSEPRLPAFVTTHPEEQLKVKRSSLAIKERRRQKESDQLWTKHLASPVTLSIKHSSSGSAAFHLSSFVRLHNRRFESFGEVGFAVPCNMLSCCDTCYLKKHSLQPGPVGWLITKIKHPVWPWAERTDDGLTSY